MHSAAMCWVPAMPQASFLVLLVQWRSTAISRNTDTQASDDTGLENNTAECGKVRGADGVSTRVVSLILRPLFLFLFSHFKISFIKIEFAYHRIHSFKVFFLEYQECGPFLCSAKTSVLHRRPSRYACMYGFYWTLDSLQLFILFNTLFPPSYLSWLVGASSGSMTQ